MRRTILMVCLAVAAGGATCAQAQYAPPAPSSPQAPHSPQYPGSPRAPGSSQAVSPELIRLHDDLRLTDSQEAAWRDYATAIAPDPQAEARHKATTDLLPLIPTPRRIALIEATMDQDLRDFRRQGSAVSTFYATLTPSQQRIFDQDTLPSASEGRPGG